MSDRMQRLLAATHVYVAVHTCGKICGACTDVGDAQTARFVADFIKAGDAVERLTFAVYRERGEWCKCFDQPEQAELALVGSLSVSHTPE